MAIDKIQSESINLTDNFAFTGTVSGAGGITESDQWRLTASFQGDAAPIASNLERVDTSGWGKIGTGMSESSGIFTFPTTGIWKVTYHIFSYVNGANRYATGAIQITTNNSSYSNIASGENGAANVSNNMYAHSSNHSLIDVTDTSNVKVRFTSNTENDNTYIQGSSTVSYTNMMFIRLGDT